MSQLLPWFVLRIQNLKVRSNFIAQKQAVLVQGTDVVKMMHKIITLLEVLFVVKKTVQRLVVITF